MTIDAISVTVLNSNCYVVHQDGVGFVVDAGGDVDLIFDKICLLGVRIDGILLTHGHFDHIGAVARLKELTGAKTYIGAGDSPLISSRHNLGAYMGCAVQPFDVDVLVADGDVLSVGSMTVKVIATPGHTRGGVSYLVDNCIFTGDTLFENSYGRTNFPTGNYDELKRSITDVLFRLPDETIVYPGHGGKTTICREKSNNLINFDD